MAQQRDDDRTTTLALYMRDIAGCEHLTRQQESELAQVVQQGDVAAMQRLVGANLPYVIYVARRYRFSGVPMSDLIGAGNLGLIRAARRYLPEKGTRFLTYAEWWIRDALRQAMVDHTWTIRMPLNRLALLQAARRQQETGGEGLEEDVHTIARTEGVPAALVRDTLRGAMGCVSLEAEISGTGGLTMSDVLQDDQPPPDRVVMERSRREVVEEALSTLEPVERDVIRLHFGFEGGDPFSLSEIGRRAGVSRERVRQIKNAALKRMRHRLLRRVPENPGGYDDL